MNKSITKLLFDLYGIEAKPGEKVVCPFCGHKSFSIKLDESIAKCFHPSCGKFIKANDGRGEGGTPDKTSANMQSRKGCTLEQYSALKKIPIPFLSKLGLSEISYLSLPAVRIPYFDEDGNVVATRYRIEEKKSEDCDNRFRWKSGTKPTLYGIWRIEKAVEKGYILLVEGESDTQTLWYHDIPAAGIPGSKSWQESWTEYLKDIPVIYVFIEPDSGGEAVFKWISNSSIKERVQLIHLDNYKDPSELYVANPDRFIIEIKNAFQNALSWEEQAKEKENHEKQMAWEKCKHIAQKKDILSEFALRLRKTGVVGEVRLAKILYLALISRFLEKPVSVVVKGPSSCGKSYVLDQVLKFFPAEVYHTITAMSERSLAYSEEPLSHRFLVICEAIGLQNDFVSYLLRSLLSEGKLRYETVDKTSNGLKARTIEREGPTGLIVTTTAIRLHPENETRILSLPVTDTKEQTRNILFSIANQTDNPIDFSEWHAFQIWLESVKHSVRIPYALTLAGKIPILHVRQRRDFTQILNLIKAHAILHQVSRETDDERNIIATLEDYASIRELIVDFIGEGIEATVSDAVRETVDAVNELYAINDSGVTVKYLSEKLNLDNSATWRRVKKAISLGYLQNSQEKGKRPAKLVPGDPLPEELEILPKVQELENCIIAQEMEGIIPPSPHEMEEAEAVSTYHECEKTEDYPWRTHLKD